MLVALAVAIAWTAWAGYAFYDLATGVRNLDPVALERRVDWVAVQQGLREDLATRSAPNAGLATGRAAVARLVRTAKLDGAAEPPPKDDGFWSHIQSASYTGGPFAFRVDLKADDDKVTGPVTLLFKWTGDWRLSRVFLPGATVADRPVPAAPRPDSVFAPPPAPTSATQTPVATPSDLSAAPRAVLYEEDSTDPQGKRHTGTAVWRTEETSPAAGGAPELAVRADITIPERPLAMTLWIRRNTDKALPASHTIEVKFDLPADSNTGGIQEVPGIMLKQTEDGRGTRLAGIGVNVAQNFFLIGLSAIELDVEHNTRMLKDRAWFDIPVSYKSKKRAVLAIEKGSTGEKIIAEALAHWNKTSLTEKEGQKR
jgi:hypothetical protein